MAVEMPKSELKTKETNASVEDFLNSLDDEQQRSDSFKVLEMFERATGEQPKMWGPAIIGFGNCVVKYDSGREFDWMLTGFSPRKGNITLYIHDSTGGSDDLLEKLGKYKTAKVCLYVKRLSDIDEPVLQSLIDRAVERARRSAASN
jgi:hypothetical protein